jgi:hypothetical protein
MDIVIKDLVAFLFKDDLKDLSHNFMVKNISFAAPLSAPFSFGQLSIIHQASASVFILNKQ